LKKALSLIELIIAIMILTVALGSLINISKQNLFYLGKSKKSIKTNTYISLIACIDSNKDLKKQKVYLSDLVNFKNDDLRKDLKEQKIQTSSKKIPSKDTKLKNLNLNMDIVQKTYALNNKHSRNFYTFELKL